MSFDTMYPMCNLGYTLSSESTFGNRSESRSPFDAVFEDPMSLPNKNDSGLHKIFGQLLADIPMPLHTKFDVNQNIIDMMIDEVPFTRIEEDNNVQSSSQTIELIHSISTYDSSQQEEIQGPSVIPNESEQSGDLSSETSTSMSHSYNAMAANSLSYGHGIVQNLQKDRTCMKLDQGFKAVLRAFRNELQNLFNRNKLYSKGHHHWIKSGNENKWFEKVKKFLTDYDISFSSEKEVAIAILMIFPAFGPSSGSNVKKQFNGKTKVFRLLGKKGMEVYKDAITINNNETLRDKFFQTPIIQAIWRQITPRMGLKDFFKGEANEKISPTYSEITRIMSQTYQLSMCSEWKRAFPAKN